MATTAPQMVADANARIPTVTPHDAHDRADGRHRACCSTCASPPSGKRTSPEALQVPRGILEFKADPASPRHDPALDPVGQVIVFCRSGARAALAAATLTDLGYTDVLNMAGGITAWKEAGLPTVDAHADI